VNTSPAPTSEPSGDTTLSRLSGWCFDHRRTVLVAWILVAAAVIGTAVSFGSQFSDNYSSASLASQRAQNVLSARFPAQAGALSPAGARLGGDNETVWANGCRAGSGTDAVYGAVARKH